MPITGRVSARLCLVAAAWGCAGWLSLAYAGEPGASGKPDVAVASVQVDPTRADAAEARPPAAASRSAALELPGVPLPGPPQPPAGLDAARPDSPRRGAAPVIAAVVPPPAHVDAPRKPDPAPQPASISGEGDGAGPGITPASPTPAPQEAAPATPVDSSAAAAHGVPKDALRQALADFVKAETPALRQYRNATVALRTERLRIADVYALRDAASFWVEDAHWNGAARRLIELMSHADEDGLDLSAYPVPAMPGTSPAEQAAAELALSEAVAVYGLEASGGRIEPAQVAQLIGERPAVVGADRVLVDVAIAADPVAVLRAYNPPQPGYAALREKLGEILREQAPVARARIPAGPPLKVGMRDPRVTLIRARFGLDLAPPQATSDSLIYDTVVATAVAGFQRANGLPASGVLNARTIAALSGGRPEVLENEIIANMERWRWMPRDMGDTRVEINLPDYSLALYHGTDLVHRARVIVGKPTTPTPVFSNIIRYVTINPSWYVPQSIIKKEMLPHLADDPDYLTRHGYEVTRHGDTLAVRQPPGDRNALGHIVFWFPNDYAVYLHDTPTRAMFGNDKRAFSHGCVRLDQPFKFAELVMGRDNGWTEDKLRHMIGSSERYINMPQPVPIHIMYFTAFVDGVGTLQLRDDLYGYSGRVKAALGLQG